MKILDQAKKAGYIVLPVTFKCKGITIRRKGYDIIDPVTRHIQYTLEPKSYPKGSTFSRDKWLIHDKGNGIRYANRVNLDLTKRELTGFTR